MRTIISSFLPFSDRYSINIKIFLLLWILLGIIVNKKLNAQSIEEIKTITAKDAVDDEYAKAKTNNSCSISIEANIGHATDSLTNDGWIDIYQVNNATFPVSYEWSNLETTNMIDSLFYGIYTVTITDFDACLLLDTFYVEVDTNDGCSISVSVDYINNATDSILNDGEIGIIVDLFTPPLTYIWSNGKTTQNIDSLYFGWYSVTVTDFDDCVAIDSFYVNYLTSGKNSTSSISPSSCENYISPSGKIWTASGLYYDTIPNAAGYDSIISIDLTILENIYSSFNDTSCVKYVSPSGKEWTTSGTYHDTIPNMAGCDSIITIDLFIRTYLAGDINCNGRIDRLDEIAGDVNNDGTIGTGEILGDVNGDGVIGYGEVEGDANGNGILDGNEISFMKEINGVGVSSVYPVPVRENLNIEFIEIHKEIRIKVLSIGGELLIEEKFRNTSEIELKMDKLGSGDYIINLISYEKLSRMIISKL